MANKTEVMTEARNTVAKVDIVKWTGWACKSEEEGGNYGVANEMEMIYGL